MPRTGSPTIEAPATCGNFGPGFDVFSLAVDRRGDRVRVSEADADEVRNAGIGAASLTTDFARNCASAAASFLRQATGVRASLRVEVDKGIPPGSGMGSSASSSAAGALAFYHAFKSEAKITPAMLLDAASAGERAGAGGDHRDDVAAALFGGLQLVPPAPWLPRRLEPPRAMWLAYALPEVVLETRRMRAVLPSDWPRSDVVFNLHQVARLVDAVHRGDVAAIGHALEDRLAVPHRSPFVPGFDAARNAALAVGGLGFSLSGSGPACFAVAASAETARAASGAMAEAFRAAGVAAEGFTAQACYRGVEDAPIHLH